MLEEKDREQGMWWCSLFVLQWGNECRCGRYSVTRITKFGEIKTILWKILGFNLYLVKF